MKGKKMLLVAGVLNAGFAILHLFFWNMFDWPASLATAGVENQKLMPVMNIHLILVLGVFAYACLFHAKDMLQTRLGRFVACGIGGFWLVRTVTEFIYWDITMLESQVLAVLFLALAVCSLAPVMMNRSLAS